MEAMMIMQFRDLQIIPFDEITKATNNFHEDNYLGGGGFGNVFKGELSQFKERGMVAFKRLDRQYGQGETEFLKEISTLSQYKHENLIALLGYCIKEREMILVYEYTAHGSLDFHLGSRDLTWTQRLKICLQAAEGLSYLHDPNGAHHMVVHRDIKSGNILLDEKWNAKIADVGLSKISPENANLVTVVRGTPGYTDPEYQETYILTEHSDVYSFGVTLFEVLCGSLCYETIGENNVRVFVRKWKESYQENRLKEIIFKELSIEQIDQISLKFFSDIAYQCLEKSREKRPTMVEVVSNLKVALQAQERYDVILKIPLPKKYADIVRAAVSHPIYSSIEQLKDLLSEGILVNGGKTWLSINEKGEHIERNYIQACLNLDEIEEGSLQHPSDYGIVNSRFPGGLCYQYYLDRFKARVRGEYLTPQISYTANLVFRFKDESDVNEYINPLRYKIDGEDETKVFIIYPSIHEREDGWFIVPLYHFTSQHTTADLQFAFQTHANKLLVAGIEFQPSEEKVQLPSFEEYQCIIEAASQSLVYRSLQELKQILSIGIHLKDYKTWFSLNEKGEHCHMISMKDCLIPNEDSTPRYESDNWSRFPAGFYLTTNKGFKTHVKTQLLSPSITYTVNLIYYCYSMHKQVYVDLKYRLRGETTTFVVYLANQRQDDFLNMAELFQFTGDGSIVDLEIDFDDHGTNIRGVEGILFQPLEKVEDQVSKDDKVENIQTISNSGSDSLIRSTKEKLYSIFRRRSLIDNGQQKCLMLSAKATWVIHDDNSAESRFGEVLVITAGNKFELVNEIKPEVLSADTTYASYFVYKLPSDQSKFEFPLEVIDTRCGILIYSYLVSPPNTPVIGQKFDENRYNPLNRHKLSALPRQRSDGWMEVRAWEFQTQKTPETVSMNLFFRHPAKKDLCGLIIHGIELRPI